VEGGVDVFGPPGWPAVLSDPAGSVTLRPYHRSDALAWSRTRVENEKWLSVWEPTPPRGSWAELNSPAAFKLVHRELRRVARSGSAMPFAVCLRMEDGAERLVGQVTLGNIVRRAFCSAYAGYWVDARVAGRGVIPTALALAVDHAFTAGGLHRIEVNIRPENAASRRVVEKLGFREEAYHARYLHIDGAWRDHVGYALTTEDVAGEGGLLARWHRLRGIGKVAPDRA
jgi:ribosomal-protein-alanine N-acetyltransferase